MINEKEKYVLKRLVISSEWELIVKVAEQMINDIKNRVKLKDNEWDSLKSLIGDEKEVEGITNLIQTIQKYSRESK